MKNAHADAVPVAQTPIAALPRAARLSDYVALTKPRLNFLVVATSAAGYYLGTTGPVDPLTMATAVGGTALVAGGAAVLNQVYERDTDALMLRTRRRPLPDGRVAPLDATAFGIGLAATGLALLATRSNAFAALLAAATLVTYLLIYTPIKRRTPLATLVGAVPGALPPLIGWTAARGAITAGGLALFAIVFLWQVPHFMAIAWMYRDDYGKAGFPMLPVVEPDGRRTGRHAAIFALLLVPATIIPTIVGVSGRVSAVVAFALGLALAWLALQFAADRSDRSARRLFFASITYLPLIWIAMILDKL